MFGISLLGAVIAGLYGAVHDQISYSISPEYFTKMKFEQFSYADFGFPPRVCASEVGFLATWWVGLFAGWYVDEEKMHRSVVCDSPDCDPRSWPPGSAAWHLPETGK
jgi:hypothetical protein